MGLMAQTTKPTRDGSDRATDRATTTAAASGEARQKAVQEGSSKAIAEAYTKVLYLTQKQEAEIAERLANMGREMDAALAQLQKAQRQVEHLYEAEMKKIDEGFSKEQIALLETARRTGEWNCMVDPCKCSLQPDRASRTRPASSGDRTRQAAPARGGDNSRVAPDGGRPTRR